MFGFVLFLGGGVFVFVCVVPCRVVLMCFFLCVFAVLLCLCVRLSFGVCGDLCLC